MSKKLKQVDFNYLFFDTNLRDKLVPKIEKIDRLRSEPGIQN